MTGIKEGQPFSATYNKLRGVAGGMTYGKSDTEFKDNSFDEGATYSNTKIAIIDGHYHIVNIDDGKGAPSLPHLFGLGEAMPRKTDEKTCGGLLYIPLNCYISQIMYLCRCRFKTVFL